MQTLFKLTAIFISLFTATGVFIHDGRIDKAATISPQAVKRLAVSGKRPGQLTADLGLAVDPHTHPEHKARTMHGFSYQNPSFPPREQKMKKFLQQNIEPRGRHAFDNHYLPIVS